MSEERIVFMLNRGRVVEVRLSEVPEQLKKGWIRIENPKQDYYAQFDVVDPSKLIEDERVTATHIMQNSGNDINKLGIVQV